MLVHDDAEALVVFNFLRPENAIRIFLRDDAHISVENRIAKRDDDWAFDKIFREIDRVRRATHNGLLNRLDRPRRFEIVKLMLQVTRDENEFSNRQVLETIKKMLKNSFTRNMHQRFCRRQ